MNLYVPCRRCVPCSVARKTLWAARIELEAQLYTSTPFVSLTYDDSRLPAGSSLVPDDLKDWTKRIRKKMEPLRLRYFACGEYGEQGARPHYHVALFGYPLCRRVESHFSKRGHCCDHCDRLLETWGNGFVHSTPLSEKGARYIAGYVTKKMTRKDDPRLGGRYPEFARMSNRPGIGADYMRKVADTMTRQRLCEEIKDVPQVLAVGRTRFLPLGRYLKSRLRLELGRDPETPQEIKQEYADKMLLLQEYARENGISPKEVLRQLGEAKANQLEFFEKLRKKYKL